MEIELRDKTGKKRRYKLSVALIKGKNILGHPMELTLIDDSQTVTLQGGEEFMTIFVPIEMFEKTKI